MEQTTNLTDPLYHLARLALSGSRQEILMQVRRIARRLRPAHPEVSERLDALLAEQPTREAPLRSATVDGVPVDADSRLNLARVQYPVDLDIEPIWSEDVGHLLEQVIAERSKEEILLRAGITPTRSLLFVGPPGVGKTLAAAWLARALGRPLLTLDLAAVMNRFLGRTGNNIRQVLDYARGIECVLLLDELDAVAKRRDDAAEIGELKRLVTVLLQEIDDWPASGILVAATNHPDLLDPAAWRRFEMVVEFPMPDDEQVRRSVAALLGAEGHRATVEAAVVAFRGLSFSDIERDLLRARREALVLDLPVEDRVSLVLAGRVKGMSHSKRVSLAGELVKAGQSRRKASELTGIHRNTIRKQLETDADGDRASEDLDDAGRA